MFDSKELQEFYKYQERLENMGDDRVMWMLNEYKEKVEKLLPFYIHRPTREFKNISTQIWAIEEIQERVLFKSPKNALIEVARFQALLEDYDGRNARNRKHFQIAAEVAQTVYEMIIEQFTL